MAPWLGHRVPWRVAPPLTRVPCPRYTHLSSGELLRQEVLAGTSRGLQVTGHPCTNLIILELWVGVWQKLEAEYQRSDAQIYRLMETGELVPTILVLHLLTEAMVGTASLPLLCFAVCVKTH